MFQASDPTDRPNRDGAYCPPAPKPQARPLKPLALLRTLKRRVLSAGLNDGLLSAEGERWRLNINLFRRQRFATSRLV